MESEGLTGLRASILGKIFWPKKSSAGFQWLGREELYRNSPKNKLASGVFSQPPSGGYLVSSFPVKIYLISEAQNLSLDSLCDDLNLLTLGERRQTWF